MNIKIEHLSVYKIAIILVFLFPLLNSFPVTEEDESQGIFDSGDSSNRLLKTWISPDHKVWINHDGEWAKANDDEKINILAQLYDHLTQEVSSHRNSNKNHKNSLLSSILQNNKRSYIDPAEAEKKRPGWVIMYGK